MSTAHVLILGAIAGGTIFLGLPIGRMQNLRGEARETPSISPTRAAIACEVPGDGWYSPIGKARK